MKSQGISVSSDKSLVLFFCKVKDISGWLVTDLVSPSVIQSQQDALGGQHWVSINNTAVMKRLASQYYWAAPKTYLGNKVCLGWRC